MVLAFLAGMIIGAVLGVVVMCVMAVASDADDWSDAW